MRLQLLCSLRSTLAWLRTGAGINLMPANPDVSWWNATTWKNDGLYKEITSGASGLQYFLGHHTFNHENLNAITYYDAVQQIRLNQVRRRLCSRLCALGFSCIQAERQLQGQGVSGGKVAAAGMS